MKACCMRMITVFVAAATLPSTLLGQSMVEFPTKPVRIIVTQPPGGANDIVARLLSSRLSENLGQQFVVDDRGTAGVAGLAVLTTVAKTTPDGYTLLAVNSDFTISPALYKNFPIDPIRDFAPISLVARAPYLLVVNASRPIMSVNDLVTLARAQPGKLTFGAGNTGSGVHLSTMWFMLATNIKATYIPYKGASPALLDLVGGRIDASLTNVLSSGPLVRSGQLHALGVSTAERSKVLPDVPTIAEQGVPGYDAYSFQGYLAPAKTPLPIVNKLSAEFAKVVKLPDITRRFSDDGSEPIGDTPAQFGQIIAAEILRWRNLVKDVGITLEDQ